MSVQSPLNDISRTPVRQDLSCSTWADGRS